MSIFCETTRVIFLQNLIIRKPFIFFIQNHILYTKMFQGLQQKYLFLAVTVFKISIYMYMYYLYTAAIGVEIGNNESGSIASYFWYGISLSKSYCPISNKSRGVLWDGIRLKPCPKGIQY
jgi:hypothetical protein